jgi:hypothetical protein
MVDPLGEPPCQRTRDGLRARSEAIETPGRGGQREIAWTYPE